MSVHRTAEAPATAGGEFQEVAALLGGTHVLRRKLTGPLDAHDMIVRGLPGQALQYLIKKLVVLRQDALLEKAVGVSLRTFQRHKGAPNKPLNKEQGGRTWKFAEILARATAVFGSQEAAERWLGEPALGLNQRRPIDLLATPAGVELVEDLLGRLKYGVYT